MGKLNVDELEEGEILELEDDHQSPAPEPSVASVGEAPNSSSLNVDEVEPGLIVKDLEMKASSVRDALKSITPVESERYLISRGV